MLNHVQPDQNSDNYSGVACEIESSECIACTKHLMHPRSFTRNMGHMGCSQDTGTLLVMGYTGAPKI